MTFRFTAIKALLLIALCQFAVAAQRPEQATVLHACSDLFGAALDSSENLFEINSAFVLQPTFDSNGTLTRLAVFPKYWLEEKHPEWQEPARWPLLSPLEYQRLLTRLDAIKLRGKLLEPARGGAVTNMTLHLLDKYENAYVVSGWAGDDGVRFMDLYPFRELRARVTMKRHSKSPVFEENRVLIGDLNYFMRPSDYRKVRPGKVQRLQVVGPMHGYCFAGHCNP